MQVHLSELRVALDNLRKSGKIGYWNLSYGESLWTRSGEYLQVGLLQEAELCMKRLEKCMERQLPKVKKFQKKLPPIQAFDKEYLDKLLNFISEQVSRKRMLIPAPERESTERHIERLRKRLLEEDLYRLHEEILSLRSGLVARLKRSYRARSAILPRIGTETQAFVLSPSAMVGLYNSHQTLENVFALVGERDPIWVEDFLELYSELFRYAETLVPEKKLKKL